eukprot:Colp12_sorted_trinity150504_noHs@29402
MAQLRAIKNVVNNYTDMERKVREATSNDPWGASGTLMAEIAEATDNYEHFPEIMGMIWKRLNDSGKNWRHVYKSLILLDYLVKNGAERVTHAAKENFPQQTGFPQQAGAFPQQAGFPAQQAFPQQGYQQQQAYNPFGSPF